MYCTVKEIIREVLDTDVPDSECVFAVVLTRGDVRHIAQDWSLTDDELEVVMQRLDDAFEHGADVSVVHDVVRELMEEKRASRQVTVPAVMLEKIMALAGSEMKRLYAIDVLIETQGEVCLLPLPGDAAERLFPSVRFRVRERSRHKSALVMQKYSRQQAREAEQKARAYQALVAQAEIELAFHSPETVGSWHARWSDRVAEHDLETLFWQWGERFPSLAGMERWQWQDMPFWQVIAEASLAAREAGHAVREMERWMVPNKLREAA